MPAHCGSCGSTVMTFRQYLSWSARRPAKCAHCGAEVTQRHVRKLEYGRAILFVLAVLAFFGLRILRAGALGSTAAAFALALALATPLYYWGWHQLPWDPVQPGAAARPAPPPPG